MISLLYVLFIGIAVSVINADTNDSSNSSNSFQQRAEETYKRVIPCLLNNRLAHDHKIEELKPPHDLKEHYLDLLEKTRVFRGVPYHEYHYTGPWIENHFIDHFMSKPFEYYNGFVPLFVQWVDIHVYDMKEFTPEHPRNTSIPGRVATIELLKPWLRKDVIYLTVSQDDQGIGIELSSAFPNIFVFSAGGYGHVPIPLIGGEIPFKEPRPDHKYGVDIGFYGNPRPALARSRMLREIEGYAHSVHMSYRSAQSNNWVSMMLDTKFNLAPRGYGRTSFRLAEVIQSGRIPVYVYDDERWVPYDGSNISIETYGYVGRMGRMLPVVNELKSTSDAKYSEKLAAVKRVRQYFTYEGVVQQIDAFVRFTGGASASADKEASDASMRAAGVYLRCERVPDKDHRRMSEEEQRQRLRPQDWFYSS